jgi:hypothetical protein
MIDANDLEPATAKGEGLNLINSILHKIGRGIGGRFLFEYEKTKDYLKIKLDTRPK